MEVTGDSCKGVKVRMVGPAVAVLGAELPKLAKEIANSGGVPLMVHVGDYITHDDVARQTGVRSSRRQCLDLAISLLTPPAIR